MVVIATEINVYPRVNVIFDQITQNIPFIAPKHDYIVTIHYVEKTFA